jgi:hypothetical protein
LKTRSNFTAGRPGYEFKDGKLYHFDSRHVLVMSPWPDPRAWLKRRSHDWKPTRAWADRVLCGWLRADRPDSEPDEIEPKPIVLPSGQMLLPGILQPDPGDEFLIRFIREHQQTVSRYTELIPDEILARVSRYGTRRWHVLNLFARCPGALDLDESNPALLYALASNWVFHKPPVARPMRAARSLVFKRQRRVLDWLGFPATESVRRILSRIAPASLSVAHLLYLRSALQDSFVMECLRHSERINAGALRLITSPNWRRYVTPRLITEVGKQESQDDLIPDIVRLLGDTVNMANMVEWRDCPRRFGSLQRLKAVHDALARALSPEIVARHVSLPASFDAPPFPGTEAILPIRTPDQLFEEGYIQSNCAASRAEAIIKGNEYLYRVLRPIRATLSIVRTGNGWAADQLAQAFNEPVDEGTRAALFRELFFSGRGDEQSTTVFGLPLPV